MHYIYRLSFYLIIYFYYSFNSFYVFIDYSQYTFKKNERIIAMFNGFDDVLNEEAMWQISEAIKPRGGRKNNSNT